MKQTRVRWILVSIAGLILLICLALPAIPPAKARATRIQAVNNLARSFPERAFVLNDVVVTNGVVPAPRR